MKFRIKKVSYTSILTRNTTFWWGVFYGEKLLARFAHFTTALNNVNYLIKNWDRYGF